MKKILKTFALVIALMISSTILLSACSTEPSNRVDTTQYEAWITTMPQGIGGNYVAIDDSMSAIEMFFTAVDNIDLVDWTASISFGDATTQVKVVANIDVIQFVSTHKIIDNKNSQTYIETTSATVDGSEFIKKLGIAVLEQTYSNPSGEIYFRDCDKPIINENGYVVANDNNYNKTEKYSSVDDYVEKKTNNPFIFGVYDIREDTVLEATKVHNDEEGYWTVTLDLDPIEATYEYVKVMEYMVGVSCTIDFQNCKLTYEIWDNGLLRTARVQEDYKMVILGAINGIVALDTISYNTYDSTKYDINDYIFGS